MINLFKNNIILILNIILGITIFPLLFIISVVNIENIFQFNFGDIYTIIYYIYLFIGIIGLLLVRFLKFNNPVFNDEFGYTVKQIVLITILLIPSFFINHHFLLEHLGESNLYLRSYGKISFFYFGLALSVSPVLKFVKNIKFRSILILCRKVLGIISFIFFFKHGLEYFAIEYIYQVKQLNTSYFGYVYENILDRYDALTGFIAGVLMLLLGITSNKFSIKLLSGKGWKKLQLLVFPAFFISVIHIAFASRFDNFYTFLFVFVVGIRTIAYFSSNNKITTKSDKKTTKYICIPCGYIYDESKGDPDGGIIPGTKFEDIPDNWYCPVCGVGKSDFEPYYEDDNTIFGGYLSKVESFNMLTSDVLELKLKLDNDINVLKGQYAILLLNDFDGEFSRAYSIVEENDGILTFGIKLDDNGRGGRTLKNIKLGDTIKVKGIYGNFVLKDTINPKVFIATGTGLSPIMNMLSEKLSSKNNYIFIGAQTEKDLFYLDKINNIENLIVNIYISREKTEKYNNGRIDLTKYSFTPDTEFYICGNPGVVTSTKEYLVNAGYRNIYLEKF